jgi:hypothetical protein
MTKVGLAMMKLIACKTKARQSDKGSNDKMKTKGQTI